MHGKGKQDDYELRIAWCMSAGCGYRNASVLVLADAVGLRAHVEVLHVRVLAIWLDRWRSLCVEG